MNRRYGIWLIVSPRSFKDPRIWKEDKDSYQLQTPFQRAIGVRYAANGERKYPDSLGGFTGFSKRSGPPKSVAQLLKGFFTAKPPLHHRLQLRPGHSSLVAGSRGFVVLWAPHLRKLAPSAGVRFVGTVSVREQPEP